MPNPVGDDKAGEFIKIFNDGNQSVSLGGWKLKDTSGKTFNLSGEIKAGEELSLSYSQTKIVLNNNGETIYLYDGAGKLIDELSYGGAAEEGQVVQRQAIQRQATSQENLTGVINKQVGAGQIIAIDILVSVAVAGIMLYIILKTEEVLEIKLF